MEHKMKPLMNRIDLNKAKDLLTTGEYTCVICKDDEIHTSIFRGVKPLVTWYAGNSDFTGFSAADKVVGKATAFLYIMLQIKTVYAGVISRGALELLQSNQIQIEYGTLVENIINRQGDGICPFEAAVLAIEEPKEAYKAIRAKMQEMNITL